MTYPTKIATCCYCGTRAALVLGKDRHELSCSSCGAPLHNMKRLRQEPTDARRPVSDHGRPARQRSHIAQDHRPSRPKKRRKSLMRVLIKEAFDVIEDILD